MKPIEEQIRAMAEQWPEFTLTERFDERSAEWQGVLAPDKREHVVRIQYRVPIVLENISIRDAQPRVQVLSPLLEWHSDYEEGPLPHVYPSKINPKLPYLCLFSPSGHEWSIQDLISDTTVFWAAEWLYFYEGWLVTKKWRGGGRHLAAMPDGVKRLEAV